MGAWGVGVLQDDFAKDVHSDYIDGFNAGRDRNANLHVLTEQHRQSLADDDEARSSGLLSPKHSGIAASSTLILRTA